MESAATTGEGPILFHAFRRDEVSMPFLALPDTELNVGSVLSLRGVPDQVAYSAAKHGVLGLTRALAHLAAPRRITVNCICPGWTRTEMAEGRMRALGLDEEALAASVPIGRFIEPEEVASLM